MTNNAKKMLDAEGVQRAIVRIAHEILERNHGTENLVLVGIRTRGVFIAERLQKQIQQIEQKPVPIGTLDITLYRDDLGEIGAHAAVRQTELPFDMKDKIVVLVDDVLYTGRTIRAALDAIIVRLRTGCQWNQLPSSFPDDSSVHRTFVRWTEQRVFEAIWADLIEACEDLDGVEWVGQAADGSMGKARKGGRRSGQTPRTAPKTG